MCLYLGGATTPHYGECLSRVGNGREHFPVASATHLPGKLLRMRPGRGMGDVCVLCESVCFCVVCVCACSACTFACMGEYRATTPSPFTTSWGASHRDRQRARALPRRRCRTSAWRTAPYAPWSGYVCPCMFCLSLSIVCVCVCVNVCCSKVYVYAWCVRAHMGVFRVFLRAYVVYRG